MRFGLRRGSTLAFLLGIASCLGATGSASADLFHRVIPRETPALDYRTGTVMMAPAIPNGCYTKDYVGGLLEACGLVKGAGHGLIGKAKGLCHLCNGLGCGLCSRRAGCDDGSCGGAGTCGLGHGHGLGLGHGCGDGAGLGLGHPGLKSCGRGVGAGCGLAGGACGTHGGVVASAPRSFAGVGKITPAGQSGLVTGSGQAVVGIIDPNAGAIVDPSGGACGGRGCGLNGGLGSLLHRGGHGHGGDGAGVGGEACGSCFGRGCGACKGTGLLNGLGGLCRGCGGRGCALCSVLKGTIAKLCHKGDIKYFVGAGGPVPLTPGYVPYVNPVRSPRDFFSFPPYSDIAP